MFLKYYLWSNERNAYDALTNEEMAQWFSDRDGKVFDCKSSYEKARNTLIIWVKPL